MSWLMVDVETDGPCPGLYSMIALGCVVVEPGTARSFSAKLAPLPDARPSVPEALRVTGVTRAQIEQYPDPMRAMHDFAIWIAKVSKDRPRFISDNNGFDWQFVNYYFWRFCGTNPFGHSSTNLGSLYKGLVKNMKPNFKHLRQTKHTHDPVDDARGNVEALLHMRARLGMEFPL